LPYMSTLIVEHELSLFVGYFRREQSHCHSQHSARRRNFQRSMRFDLFPGVYEVVMLSSVSLIREHTWWLPYQWCLKCDLIALVLYFHDKTNFGTIFYERFSVINTCRGSKCCCEICPRVVCPKNNLWQLMQQTLQAESSALMTVTLNTTLIYFLSFRCLYNQSWCKFGFGIVWSRRVPVVYDYILLFSTYFQAERTETYVWI
jgi:hypothetical protein